MSSRKVTGLPLPETPREAPPEVHGLVDAIESKLGESDVMGAVGALACAFEYLTRFFSAASGGICQCLELQATTDVEADFEAARSKLKERLLLLGEKSTNPDSKLVRSVFFVGATRKTPTPRRHARLLDLGGIPIRGYLNLAEWIELIPEESRELASDSKANREMLRYLPILKEWLTATSSFFLDTECSELRDLGQQQIEFDLTVSGKTTKVGPISLGPAVYQAVKPFLKASAESPAPARPESTPEPDVEPTPEPTADPTSDGQDIAALDTGEFPIPEEVKKAVAEKAQSSPAAAVSDVPKIEVVGLEDEEDESVSGDQDSSPAPTPEAPTEASSVAEKTTPAPPSTASSTTVADSNKPVEAPRQSDSLGLSPRIENPEQDQAASSAEISSSLAGESRSTDQVAKSVTEALRSPLAPDPDVPDALALPDPEVFNSSEGQAAVTSSGALPRAELSSSQPSPLQVEEPTDKLSMEELEAGLDLEPDPVGAPTPEVSKEPVSSVLNKPKPVKKKQPPPVLELYPVAEGPPPEFFDEVEVEADYPEILTVALTDLNGAIESNDSLLICGQLQRCFDIMIQFFAGLAGAILCEIDEEALFDFDIEDGRFDLEVKIDLIVTSLSALEEYWEGNDSANLVWSVFYDTLLPATDPNCAYLHTRLLGVEGLVPDPFLEFSELCDIVPGEGKLKSQDQCRHMAHFYLPILSFWLENAMPLFLECDIDFVEEDDGGALSWAASVAGATLDGTSSGLWLEIASDRWNLPRPELAPVFVSGDAPDVLLPIFDELNAALEKADFPQAGIFAKVALDFLLQYFTGCAASLWRQQGAMNEQALELFYPEASLAEKERLLLLSLGGMSTESEVGSSLGKLFSKGSLQYRAIAQRGQPQDMKPVSEWATSREGVKEEELLIYLPLLRSWIGAANPWFSAGEQLFEEPSPDGVLEGVVAYGDDFLEMVDPEYVIQLARECLELVAPFDEEQEVEEGQADAPFTGRLPQLPILAEGPPVLVGHVGRLLESANDRRTSNAWLGSSFEYLIQYFAGMCTTVLGGKDAPIDRTHLGYFRPDASLREREILLVTCIEHLKAAATGSVQESVRDIFLKPDGSYREHTKYLGALGAASFNEHEMLLSYWCRTRHQAGHLTTTDLHFGMSALNSWLDAAKPFFASCEHYAEDPGADGQEEMVVELADDYLDMVLPDYAIQIPARGYYELLYKESDSDAVKDAETYFPEDVRPELLGPQEVVLGGVADTSGDELLGAAVDLGGDGLFAGSAPTFDSDDLFAGSSVTQKLDDADLFSGPASASEEDTVTPQVAKPEEQEKKAPKSEQPEQAQPEKRKKKKRKSKKQELGSAVLELYKKERLEKARKRAEARAKKLEVEPSVLKYTMQYRGLKNSKQLGGRGHFGLIELSNAGGGELKGTVEPAHPCVKVSPTRFEGNSVRVVYQVDPSDMPSTGRTGLTINTQDERIILRLDRLVPTSWWRERTTAQALSLISAPSLIYGVWLLMLLGLVLGPSLGQAFVSFGYNTQIEALPWATHLKAWMFAMLAILPGATGIPAGVKWLFAKLDYTVQEEIRWALIPTMMLPTVVMATLMYATDFWVFNVPPTRLPLLANRLVITVMMGGLNLLATSLFSLQTTMWWEDNRDSEVAKRTFIGFWIATVLLGVVVTFFMW